MMQLRQKRIAPIFRVNSPFPIDVDTLNIRPSTRDLLSPTSMSGLSLLKRLELESVSPKPNLLELTPYKKTRAFRKAARIERREAMSRQEVKRAGSDLRDVVPDLIESNVDVVHRAEL